MKVSREQAAANRERIVEVAGKLFRENGFDGIGVADLMKAAGLTHGGFYGHFSSRDELIAEAIECALQDGGKSMAAVIKDIPSSSVALGTLIDVYLSLAHPDQVGTSCAVAT